MSSELADLLPKKRPTAAIALLNQCSSTACALQALAAKREALKVKGKTQRGLPMEREPHLVISSASQRIVVDDVPFKVDIYKLEGGDGWSLEVVTEDGTSIVWDHLFDDDQAAYEEALVTIKEEGPAAFVRGD